MRDYFVTCLTFNPDFLRIFLYFANCLDGTFTLRLDFVPLNACFPTELSFVDLIVTLPSFLQPENAFAPIVFTLAPMVRLVIFLLFRIAFDLIEVTLYFTPSVPVTVLIATFFAVDFDVVSSYSLPAFVTL